MAQTRPVGFDQAVALMNAPSSQKRPKFVAAAIEEDEGLAIELLDHASSA
jgi:hypothetical protein